MTRKMDFTADFARIMRMKRLPTDPWPKILERQERDEARRKAMAEVAGTDLEAAQFDVHGSEEGLVVLTQTLGDDVQSVMLYPSQVEMVTRWMVEARDEISEDARSR